MCESTNQESDSDSHSAKSTGIVQKIIAGAGAVIKDVTQTIIINRDYPQWLDDVPDFLYLHRYFLFFVAAPLQLGLFWVYFHFKDLHQIQWESWGIGVVLLFIACWTGYAYFKQSKNVNSLRIAVISNLLFCGLVGIYVERIISPERFEPDTFGIAIANLAKGNSIGILADTNAISNQIFEAVCQDIESASSNSPDSKLCSTNDSTGLQVITVRRIGAISDSQTAYSYGSQIGAEIVLWGQIINDEQGSTIMRFEILETLDQAVNPDFPVVIPVTAISTEIFSNLNEWDTRNDPEKLTDAVARQSTILSSFILGLAAYLDQNFPKAVEHLGNAQNILQNSTDISISKNGLSLISYYLGRSYHYLGRIDTGQSVLLSAQDLNKQEPAILIALALGYGSLGEIEKREEMLDFALRLLNDWLQIHPEDSRALYDRALVQEIQQRYDNAVLGFQELVSKYPDFYIAYIRLGKVTYEQGKIDESIEVLKKAIVVAEQFDTNASWAHLQLGLIYQITGQANEARIELRRAIELNPNISINHRAYAIFLEEQQEWDAALLAYEDMIAVSYQKGWAHGELANYCRRRQLFSCAEDHYILAINATNNDPLLYTGLADARFEAGKCGTPNANESLCHRALDAYEQAIVLNENGPSIYYVYAEYARSLAILGQYEEAARMYNKSLELRPIDFAVLMNLGQTYEAMEDRLSALSTYTRITEQASHFSEDQVQLAQEQIVRLQRIFP